MAAAALEEAAARSAAHAVERRLEDAREWAAPLVRAGHLVGQQGVAASLLGAAEREVGAEIGRDRARRRLRAITSGREASC